MNSYLNYYEILNITKDFTTDEIKSAFRKLAMIYHPDKNKNSPESRAKFMLIHNAYINLLNHDKKKEYDEYIQKSSIFKQKPDSIPKLPGKPGDVYKSNEDLLSYLNFLIWDVEDLIFNKKQLFNKILINQNILKILTFIDKWVLIPGGYPDYFMEARKKEKIDPMEYINIYNSNMIKKGHLPFVSITDYFYDIRKRMNKFLKKVKTDDLFKNIQNSQIRLIDSIIEAQNHTIHYLSYLLKITKDKTENIPKFNHSNSIFEN